MEATIPGSLALAAAFFEVHLGATPELRQEGCRCLAPDVLEDAAVKLE